MWNEWRLHLYNQTTLGISVAVFLWIVLERHASPMSCKLHNYWKDDDDLYRLMSKRVNSICSSYNSVRFIPFPQNETLLVPLGMSDEPLKEFPRMFPSLLLVFTIAIFLFKFIQPAFLKRDIDLESKPFLCDRYHQKHAEAYRIFDVILAKYGKFSTGFFYYASIYEASLFMITTSMVIIMSTYVLTTQEYYPIEFWCVVTIENVSEFATVCRAQANSFEGIMFGIFFIWSLILYVISCLGLVKCAKLFISKTARKNYILTSLESQNLAKPPNSLVETLSENSRFGDAIFLAYFNREYASPNNQKIFQILGESDKYIGKKSKVPI